MQLFCLWRSISHAPKIAISIFFLVESSWWSLLFQSLGSGQFQSSQIAAAQSLHTNWARWAGHNGKEESMIVLSSWLTLNKAEFHHGLHSIESSWCVIFCLIINCCRPVAEWHDQHFDHSWARHSCGPAPGAQMVSNGKHVGVGSDCYIETVDLPNTFESHEVSITNTRNLYHCLLKLQMPCSR